MNRKPLMILGAGGVFIAGLLIGGAASGTPEVREVPGPAREVASPACLRALTQADTAFNHFSKIAAAGQSGDIATVQERSQWLRELAPKYNAAKTECRAAGE